MKKVEPIKLLPKNTFYLYRRRPNKTEYWRKGLVMFAYAYLPLRAKDHSRVAFFNNNIGKKFEPSKRLVKWTGSKLKKKK